MTNALRGLAATLAASVVLTGCLGTAPTEVPSSVEAAVRVGSWPGVEGPLLARVLVGLLQAEGLRAEVVAFADAADARQALELDDVDVLAGYTGAIWLEVMERSDPPGDPRTSFARVREFDENNGITWVRPVFGPDGSFLDPPVNATFTFFVQPPDPAAPALATLSDLASRLAEDPAARLCMDQAFADRPDGREALFRAYGVALERQDIAATPADAVLAVVNGECLAGLSTASDGAAWGAGLQPLRDDLEVFPAFIVATQVRDEARLARPQLVPAVAPLTAQLTAQLLGTWNARLLDGEDVDVVVAEAVATLRTLAGRASLPSES